MNNRVQSLIPVTVAQMLKAREDQGDTYQISGRDVYQVIDFQLSPIFSQNAEFIIIFIALNWIYTCFQPANQVYIFVHHCLTFSFHHSCTTNGGLCITS